MMMHEPPHFTQRRYTFISTLLTPYTIPFSLLFIPPILLQEAQNCHIYEEQKSIRMRAVVQVPPRCYSPC